MGFPPAQTNPVAAWVQNWPRLGLVLAWVAVCLTMIASSPHLPQGRFPDVDDAMRLVQVRDLLAGQGWFDLHQYRLGPPEGTLMHWSRLVDLPLAGLIALLGLVLPQGTAEQVASFTIPLLLLLATMAIMARLARERLGAGVALLAALSFALVPMVPAQFQPLRIDHHSWQVLAVAVALWGILRPDAKRGALVAGLAMATGLMISLETIVMAAGFAFVLGLRWLTDPAQGRWLVRYLQSLAAGLIGLFALTRGLSDLAPHCDAIAPAHLGFFAVVAAGASVLGTLPRPHPLVIIAGLGASGLAGLALVGWAAPACLAPPFAALDPLVHDLWYRKVTEGLPLWQRTRAEALPAAVQCAFALAIALHQALRAEPAMRSWWRDYALVLAVAVMAGLATYRSIAFAGLLATIPLGWFAARMIARWQGAAKLTGKLGVAAALYVAFLPAVLIVPVLQWSGDPDAQAVTTPASSTCAMQRHGASLNALAPATLFASLDIGPGILAYSHHRIIASGHHRAERGMRDVIAAFTSDPATARRLVAANKAQYLVACTDLMEMTLYANASGPNSLAAQLIAGDTPDWLEPVPLAAPSSLKVWRVRALQP